MNPDLQLSARENGESVKTPIILHAHMFKNAGTTLDWSLARSFGAGFLDHRDDDQLRDKPEALDDMLEQNATLQAVSSHWLPLPLSSATRRRSALVFFLRHPLDRVRSVYEFERRQADSEGPSPRQAKALSFREFVAWRLEPGRGPVFRDFQTRYLSGRFGSENMEESLEIATSLVEATPTFGLVDRYHDSMVLIEHELGKQLPELDLAYRIQNRTARAESSLPERLSELEEALGDVFEPLVAANQSDLALYHHAQAQFEDRMTRVDDFSGRVENLHRRCEALTE